jgi:membrane protein implicated in regulation of membrane protease activity
MSAFDMVAFIVLVVCITKVLTSVFQRRRAEPDPELVERLRRVETLEERVRVLEKIVTDGRYDLKRQLDELERTP